jgi:hypothetical protein
MKDVRWADLAVVLLLLATGLQADTPEPNVRLSHLSSLIILEKGEISPP